MYAGLLLLKKGIIKNEEAISTIKHQINLYKLPKFEVFLETPNCKKILKELNKDNKLYYTLLSHLQKKMIQEVGLQDPTAKIMYDYSVNADTAIKDIEPELENDLRKLLTFYLHKSDQLSHEVKREFSIGLCDLFLSVRSQQEFQFLSQGIPYDWHQFETNFNMNFVNSTLTRALQDIK